MSLFPSSQTEGISPMPLNMMFWWMGKYRFENIPLFVEGKKSTAQEHIILKRTFRKDETVSLNHAYLTVLAVNFQSQFLLILKLLKFTT